VSIIYEPMVSYGKVPYFINDKNKKQFRRPTSLTVDHSGNIFVVDEGIKVRQQCKLHNKRGDSSRSPISIALDSSALYM
jgi:hypothetical protein